MAKKVVLPTHLICEPQAFGRLRTTEIYEAVAERRVAVLSGKGPTYEIGKRLIYEMKLKPAQVKHFICPDNSLRTIDELEAETQRNFSEMIIGVGGGKVLDVSKVVGARTNVPVMLVPTALSNDAICSPVGSVRVSADKSISIAGSMPWAVVIDLDIAAHSPNRLLSSGIGDLLSNKTALADWKLAHRVNQEKISTFACLIADHAIEAFMHASDHSHAHRDVLIRVTAESLIMSGMAMAVAGSSRPCSGSEHLISHALDSYCGGKALHGEQVAVGLLISEWLQGNSDTESSMRPYFKRFGLPTHYAEIGYTKDQMILAIQKAPTLRNRYTVLNETELTTKRIGEVLEEVFPPA